MPKPQQSKKKQNQDGNNKVVAELESSRFISTNSDLALIEKTYKVRGTHVSEATSINVASDAEESILSLSEGINSDLNELKETTPRGSSIESLENKVNELSSLTRSLIQTRLEIEPKLSIIQPDIKYVDANLAYKYADLQTDSSNMSNYFNLFLGTTIAEIISIVVSSLADSNQTQLAIHATAFLLSLSACVIFYRLAKEANTKVQKARNYLDATKEEIKQPSAKKK